MTTRLYRASDHRTARHGASFAKHRRDAEAYMDNPGFGGATLWRADVDDSYVLDLTGRGWREALAEALLEGLANLGIEEWDGIPADDPTDRVAIYDIVQSFLRAGYVLPYHVVENTRRTSRALGTLYDWMVYEDDYPEGCETWMYLGDEEIPLKYVAGRQPRSTAR